MPLCPPYALGRPEVRLIVMPAEQMVDDSFGSLALTHEQGLQLILAGNPPGSLKYKSYYFEDHAVEISRELAIRLQSELNQLQGHKKQGAAYCHCL